MKLQRHRRVKRWSKLLTIILTTLCVLVAAFSVTLAKGRHDRQQAIAIGDIAQKIFMAGEIYSIDHDEYPQTNDELLTTWAMSDQIVTNSFLVTSDSQSYLGGYSHFLLESDQIWNHIAVSYAAPPTWEEVQWTRVVEKFATPNNSEKWSKPEWAVNSDPSIRQIGGGCGDVLVYIARGMTYQQVLENLQADFDQVGNELMVVDYN